MDQESKSSHITVNNYLIITTVILFVLAGPPSLQDNFTVKVLENTSNVTIDLLQGPDSFPEPTLFSWSKDGQPLMADLLLTHSNVTFATVRRGDTGNYTITATNFVLPGSPGTDQVGNDTGSFYLDVICKLFCDCIIC